MKLTKNQVRNLLGSKGRRVVVSEEVGIVYNEDIMLKVEPNIATDALIKQDLSEAWVTLRSAEKPYLIADTGITLTDARGFQHRVLTTFGKEGFIQIVVKERYLTLFRGKTLFSSGEVHIESNPYYVVGFGGFLVKGKRINLDSVVRTQITDSLFENNKLLFRY